MRKPIYKGAVGKWKRFKKDLGPLIGALGGYADVKKKRRKGSKKAKKRKG